MVSEVQAPTAICEQLCSIGPRRAGSDAERRAANAIVAELGPRSRPKLESTYVHPQWPQIYLIHVALATAGSLLASVQPAAGFAIVLATATSLYLDLSGRAYLLRRLFFRRASQNVVAPALPPERDPDRPLVLLCAHYDSGLTGAVYNPSAARAFERLRRLWPLPISPMAVVFWATALLLPPLGMRMAGIEENWVALLQLPQTLTLVVAAFLLGEIALSPPSPGANNGAAGAASAIAAFGKLREDPPQALDCHLLLTGAGESTQEGLRNFLRTHREQLSDATYLIEIDSPGRGHPRFVTSEVPVLTQLADPTLVELAAALADADPEIRELSPGPAGAASLAGARGLAAIGLTAREGREFVPEGHHTPADRFDALPSGDAEAVSELAVSLIRLLDRELGRQPRR